MKTTIQISEAHGLEAEALFRSRSGLYACLFLTLAAAAFALFHVVGRGMALVAPPVGLSFWRWLLGAIVLLPFVYPGLKANVPTIRKHLGPFMLLGGVLVTSSTLLLIGLNFTVAINSSIINAIQPVSTVLLAALVLHERLRPSQFCGVALGFIGVVVIMTGMELEPTLLHMKFDIGGLLILLGSMGYSLYAVNLRKTPQTMNPSEVLFMIIVAGCILIFPFYIVETIVYKPVPLSADVIYAIIAMSLISTVFGTLMWNRGNQLIGPSRAGMFMNLIPVFAAIMAILFLDERLHLYHVVCALLIGAGIFMVLRR